MKNMKIGQVLRSAAKRSTLLVIALLSFQTIESKNDKQSKKPVVRKHVAGKSASVVSSAVVENDNYKKTIEVEPLNLEDNIQPSVDVQTTPLQDGSVVQTKTTIEPDVEHGTVKTTVEEWTMYDYAKAAAIGAGVLGAVGLGLAYQDQIAERLNSGASQLNDWWAGEQKSVVNKNSVEVILGKKTSDWTTQDVEVLKDAVLENKDDKALDMLLQKFNSMTPEEKDLWANKNAQLAAMGVVAGGFVGGLGGAVKGAQAGAGLGIFRGAQMFRTGGSPKAIASKFAMGKLQGALIGTAAGAAYGTALGTQIGGTAGVAVGLGSDLINTMDVPADYKASDVNVDISDKSFFSKPIGKAVGADLAVVGAGITGGAVTSAVLKHNPRAAAVFRYHNRGDIFINRQDPRLGLRYGAGISGTNVTRDVLNHRLGVVKEAQRGAVVAPFSRGLSRAGALAGTGTFLYSNINPVTAQDSIDATNQNIDAGQLYQ